VSGFLGQTWCEPGTESHRSLMHATLKMAGLHYLNLKGKIMKKVMFLIVGMLLSFGASAGSMVLTNTVNSATAGSTSVSSLNTLTSIHADSGDFINNASIDDSWNMAVVDDVPGWDFRITSNQNADPFSASIYSGATLLDTFSAVAGEINFYYNFLASGDFALKIFGIANANAQTSYDIDISEVPVPAALFLFAPALLGFFGLRRKAAVAA